MEDGVHHAVYGAFAWNVDVDVARGGYLNFRQVHSRASGEFV